MKESDVNTLFFFWCNKKDYLPFSINIAQSNKNIQRLTELRPGTYSINNFSFYFFLINFDKKHRKMYCTATVTSNLQAMSRMLPRHQSTGRASPDRTYYDRNFGWWKDKSRSLCDLKNSHESTPSNPYNYFHEDRYTSCHNISTNTTQATPTSNLNIAHTTTAQHTSSNSTETLYTCDETPDMDTAPTNKLLSPSYYQARAARRAKLGTTSHNHTLYSNGLPALNKPYTSIGNFDSNTMMNTGIELCYQATRNTKDQHQNITSSFDPLNLSCVTCKSPHHALTNTQDGTALPITVVMSDQALPPMLEGTDEQSCVRIVRIEDGSLHELAAVFEEIFGTATEIPPGTVVLIGSGSHLLRSGSSIYAGAWTEIMSVLEKRYPNVSLDRKSVV